MNCLIPGTVGFLDSVLSNRHGGVDLNTHLAIASLPETRRLIFPQELWSGSVHRQARDSA